MEALDGTTIGALAFGLGCVVGHFASKADRAIAYEQGKLDGIKLIWPYYIALLIGDILRGKLAGDKAPGGGECSPSSADKKPF